MAGSAITGALSMLFDCQLKVPHGGIWVLSMGNVVTNLGMYPVAILVGTFVTALLVTLLKPNKE